MDTRFWGPSGWRLLHLITFTYSPKRKEYVKEFFSLLPFVLPCKFCRYSLTEYLEEDPIESHLTSKTVLSKWLYRIHNLVNKKLRGQGLLHEENPSYESVKKVYEERVSQGCVRTAFEGWDFLFSIVENHPFSPSAKHSSPMPNMPEEMWNSNDPVERNRWNILSSDDRIEYYSRFWKLVSEVLPFEEWRNAWKGCHVNYQKIRIRNSWKKELWRIRCCMEDKLELINKENFDSVCKRLEEYTSGCNKKKRGKTCRKRKT